MNLSGGVDLRKLVPLMWSAIKATNDPTRLVKYGSTLARLRRDNGHVTLEVLNAQLCRFEVEMHASARVRFVKGKDDLPTPVPKVLIDTMLAEPSPPLPLLDGIVRVPIFTKDGSLLTTPGYDRKSRIFLEPQAGLDRLNVPPKPTRLQIQQALARIVDDLLTDFPFVGSADRAHAVGALLLPFARELVNGPTPLHLISKPTPGSGGTLLSDVLLYPALGRDVPRMTPAHDEDEQRRTLTAKLREAPVALLLDNVNTSNRNRNERFRLESEALSSAITGTVWEDRRITTSELISVPVRCVWLASGNNPLLSQELHRRSVPIRIDPGCERPELRNGFKHPELKQWTADHRPALVSAALTLIQAWIVAGRPKGSKTLGMFESWARVLGGILDVAGIEDFLTNQNEPNRAGDDDRNAWRAFLNVWWGAHARAVVTVADVFTLAVAALELEGVDNDAKRMRLGIQLSERKDRVYGNWKIVRVGTKHSAATYRLEPVK